MKTDQVYNKIKPHNYCTAACTG